MTRLALVFMMLLPAAALADDEGSEHTAQLVGDSADTLGVTVTFDDAAGWSMSVRAKPGDALKTFQIAMPKRHAHYVVYVTPKRSAIAFVEVSAGIETGRDKVGAKDQIAWVWSPTDGKLVRSWTYGQLFTPAELGNLRRSVSHAAWHSGHAVTKAGLELKVDGAKPRTIVLDAKATTLR